MRIKNWLTFFLIWCISWFHAQIKNPVKFNYDVKEISNNQYEAILQATLEDGWHLYSKDLSPDTGIPTSFSISGKNIRSIGNFSEIGKKITEFSEAFGGNIVYYANTVTFKQKLDIVDPTKATDVTAEILYQICNDRVCLAPNTIEFSKQIAAKKQELIPAEKKKTQKDSVSTVKIEDKVEVPIIAQHQEVTKVNPTQHPTDLKIQTIDLEHPLYNCGTTQTLPQNNNFWKYLLLGFLGGMVALLTPCVFPMIPLTVSYFTKGNFNRKKGRKEALLYGGFIFLIFIVLSVPFHLVDGISGNIFNKISTSVGLNLFFFFVFLFFAGSFFGFYDIALPSSIANKTSKAEETGGIIGIFFMALTLVIISFSCTGPILGSLLGSAVTTSSNIPMLLTFALAGFGLSWAIIFGLLALFPQVLQKLPKSGNWMITLKVILGFIELGLALKFLSKADLVSKTFLLKRELFIVIWVLLTIGLVLYLFGIIRFPHEEKKSKISFSRKIIGMLGIGFIIYLLQGLIPANKPKLQLLSGLLPPLNVSYYNNSKDGILGLQPVDDYFLALQLAQKEQKPILIDFTGYGCENCRKMEEFVWSQPDILPMLQNDVVLASLYVDDKEILPEKDQTKIDIGNGQMQKIKTIGDRWSRFQQVNFNNNSQPHYVLLTPDGKLINNPVSGYMSKEDFKKFLECGIHFYKSQK